MHRVQVFSEQLRSFVIDFETMSPAQRNIIAIGGLASEKQSYPLFASLLKLVKVPRPRISFLATAKGDDPEFLDRFYAIFSTFSCIPSHLPLFERSPDLAAHILNQDIILVSGGNTRSMLAVWRAWELPPLLHQAWHQGTVLAGWSAGAICWFEMGLTDSRASGYDPIQGLGFLPGSCCPHYGDNARGKTFQQYIATSRLPSGIGIPDGVAVHYQGTAVKGYLHSDGPQAAVHLQLLNGNLVTTPLKPGLSHP